MESGPPQPSNSRKVADRPELIDRLAKLKEAALKPDWGQTLRAENSPWLPNSQLVTRSIKRSATTLKER
jgi:hypothetical protein